MSTLVRSVLTVALAIAVVAVAPASFAGDLEGGDAVEAEPRTPRQPRERNGGRLDDGPSGEDVEAPTEDRLGSRPTEAVISAPMDFDTFRGLVIEFVRGESTQDGSASRTDVVRACFDGLDGDGDGALDARELVVASGGDAVEPEAAASWPAEPEVAEPSTTEIVVHPRWFRQVCR